MIQTQIEIAAPPEEVRNVFLDFGSIASWHSGLIKSITLASSEKKTAVEKGDKLKCEIAGLSFTSTVMENSPSEFKWQGPPVYTVAGLHSFRFEPSQTTPGSTTFVQSEIFSGLLSFAMSPSMPGGKKMKAQFEGFGNDLKLRVESLHGSKTGEASA